MQKNEKTIWVIFLLSILIIAIDIFFTLANKDSSFYFDKLKLFYPALAVFSHIFLVFRFKKGLLFIALASGVGLSFEILGTSFGHLLFAGYEYSRNLYDFFIFGIPLLIPLYWTIFIYTAYSVNNFLMLSRKNKKTSPLVLAFFDALLVLSIDLFMEPIMVAFGNWQWDNSGFYYDVPSLNFVGWFLVAFIASAIFRSIYKKNPLHAENLHFSVFLIPLTGYILLYLVFAVSAFKLNYSELIVINSFIMLPPIFFSLKNAINFIKNK